MRLWNPILVVIAVGLAGAGPSGCSDDDSVAEDGGRDDATGDADGDADRDADGDADADADADAEAEDGGGTVTVLVQTRDWPADPVAEDGIIVAFDAPDGTRTERPSGADGRVTFEVGDWSAGTATATAYALGRVMASRVGIAAAESEVELTLNRLGDPAEFVELSGTAANMASATNSLVVSATVPNVAFNTGVPVPGADWSILVPMETPCTVVAVEIAAAVALPSGRGFTQLVEGWTMVDQPRVREPTTVSIDFAPPTLPSRIRGSFSLPPRAESPLRWPSSYGWVYVSSTASDQTLFIGKTTSADINPEGTGLDYDLEYVQPDGVTDPVTCYLALSDRTGREQSRVCIDGWPSAGAHDGLRFLDIPRLISPASPTDRHPLFDPVVWELFDTNVQVAVRFVRDDAVVWSLRGPTDGTTATAPQPPSTTSVAAVLGTGVGEAHVLIWRAATPVVTEDRLALTASFLVAL